MTAPQNPASEPRNTYEHLSQLSDDELRKTLIVRFLQFEVMMAIMHPSRPGLIFYHETTPEEAERIDEDGFDDALECYRLTEQPPESGEEIDGWVVLEVSMQISEDSMAPFEISGPVGSERRWCVPTSFLKEHAFVRILD
jgi:hypothetical protein